MSELKKLMRKVRERIGLICPMWFHRHKVFRYREVLVLQQTEEVLLAER